MYVGPFELDLVNQCLRRDEREVPVKPKAFQLLRFLIERRGRLVTKQELLDGLWGDAAVSDAVLKVCIRELRMVLEDSATQPKYIETLHRRGYRLIAAAVQDDPALGPLTKSKTRPHATWRARLTPASPFVGRDADLAALLAAFSDVDRSERRVVFLAGDPGSGKTALLTEFASQIAPDGPRIAVGRCLEHHGTAEPYLPILDALSDLLDDGGDGGERGASLAALLRRRAPTWLLQLPDLVASSDRDRIHRQTFGTTPERMMREMASFLEDAGVDTALVLILEDLHWSDASTLDLLHYLAIRRDPARLMVVATYRPSDVADRHHPLRRVLQELSPHRLVIERALEPLSAAEISRWLDERFPGNDFADRMQAPLQQRTGGNPLFLLHVMDDLVGRGVVRRERSGFSLTKDAFDGGLDVPESLRHLFERETERLTDLERAFLGAAAVAGFRFTAAEVAAVEEVDEIDVEPALLGLARRGPHLRALAPIELPGGRLTAGFEFSHALLQQFLYEGLPPARRARCHSRAADWIARLFEASTERAAAIADHRERAGEIKRAIPLWIQAASVANRRHAHKEAIAALNRALGLTERLDAADRDPVRIDLQVRLGRVYRSSGLMQDAATHFERATAIARDSGDGDAVVTSMLYQVSALSWLDRDRTLQVVEQAGDRIGDVRDRLTQAHARATFGYFRFLLTGWRDEDLAAVEAALDLAREAGDHDLLRQHSIRLSYFLCLRSSYRAALVHIEEGEELALTTGESFDYLLARFFGAWSLLHVGEWGRLATLLDDSESLARRNGHQPWVMMFRLQRGWLHEHLGDYDAAIELCEEGRDLATRLDHRLGEVLAGCLMSYAHLGRGDLAAARASIDETDALMTAHRPLMDWIWRIHLRHGRSELLFGEGDLDAASAEAQATLREAAIPGERIYIALADRRLAEIALRQDDVDEAARAIQRSIDVLEKEDIPFAAWRVFATAARVATRRDDPDAAARHVDRAHLAQEQLKQSLSGHPDLQARFARHPEIPPSTD